MLRIRLLLGVSTLIMVRLMGRRFLMMLTLGGLLLLVPFRWLVKSRKGVRYIHATSRVRGVNGSLEEL